MGWINKTFVCSIIKTVRTGVDYINDTGKNYGG